jgi:hypothetical protein
MRKEIKKMPESENDVLVMFAYALKCIGITLEDATGDDDICSVTFYCDELDEFKIPISKKDVNLFNVGDYYSVTFDSINPKEENDNE